MIIWGSYVINKTLGHGEFYCPNCKIRRNYSHLLPRKWGHLYWIPLFPMQDFDSYVECGTCSKKYNEAALRYDPERQAALQNQNLSILISQAIAIVARATGQRPSIELIADNIKSLLKTEPSLDSIKSTISNDDRDAGLKQIADYANGLTTRGKELVLRAAIDSKVMSLGGRAAAMAVGTNLGLSAAHINGILSETAD